MSNLLKQKIFWIMGLGLFVGVVGAFLWQTSGFRQPASVTEFPAPKIKPWAHSLSGKMNQAISVEVTTVGGVPDNDGQDLHLRAHVTVNVPVDGEVEYRWSLPSEASIVSGEIEDAFTGLQPGQTATSEIVIQGVSKEGFAKTVSFSATAAGNGKKLNAFGAFGTNSFNQMAAAAQQRDSEKEISEESEELVLKKSQLTEKLKKTHQ